MTSVFWRAYHSVTGSRPPLKICDGREETADFCERMKRAEEQLQQAGIRTCSRIAFSTRTINPQSGVEYLDKDYVESSLSAKLHLMWLSLFPNTFIDRISVEQRGYIAKIEGPVSPLTLLSHLGAPVPDPNVEIITS